MMYSILSYSIELIKLYLLQRLMGYGSTKKFILPCCALVASFAALWLLQGGLENNETEVLCGILEIVCIALFIRGRNKVISVFLGIIALWLVDIFIKNIIMTMFSESADLFANAVSLIVLAAIFAAFQYLQRPPFLKFESFGKKQVLFFMIGLLSFALYLAPYQIAGFENNSLQIERFLAVLSAISGIFLIVISINAGQKRHYREVANITEEMRKNQEKYFGLLLNREEETKRFRHDFNNHLYSIKYLLENGNTEELKKYVNDMDIVSAKLKPEIQTGSDTINAVVCELRDNYKHVNYKIDWNGFFPSDVALAPIDLSSIFYNLLANAIEAVENLPDEESKRISVTVKHSNSLLYFSVGNPCAGKAVYVSGGFETSKKNKAQHGFGSKNVALCVEKYNGELKYNVSENEFEAKVFFYNLQ